MKTAIRYQSVNDFARMAHMMNRAFERTFTPYDYASNGGRSDVAEKRSEDEGERKSVTAYLPLDIQEADETFILSAYLPGIQADDVEITVEADDLVVRGTYPAIDEEAKFIKRELFHGNFERKVAFNVEINVDEITADIENGVLTLTVPKAEEVQPKQIKVQAK